MIKLIKEYRIVNLEIKNLRERKREVNVLKNKVIIYYLQDIKFDFNFFEG